jgi:DNA gyrase inhibitor GyrI
MQDTLLHETIHAIDETLITGMTEQQVSNIASVLLAVLKDNPEFTSWILQNE